MKDIPNGATMIQALEVIVENNMKGQEALDKLYSWQHWYREQVEKENEMAR